MDEEVPVSVPEYLRYMSSRSSTKSSDTSLSDPISNLINDDTSPTSTRMSSQCNIATSFDISLPDLVTQLGLDRYKGPNVGFRNGNIIKNLQYYSDSVASFPTLIDCKLENVHFIQCKFRDTEFRNLKLVNVAFLYVDLDNVTVSDLSLEEHLWKTTLVRNAYLLGPATRCASDPTKLELGPFNPLSTRNRGDKTVVETLRLSTPSPKLARALRKFEDAFRSSLQVSLRPQQGLLVRLLDHRHIVSRIVEYCVGGNDYFFERSQRTRIVTFRQQASTCRWQDNAIHVHCPENIHNMCILALMLLNTSVARPAVPGDHMYVPCDGLKCRVSELHNLRPASDAALVLHFRFEGAIGSIKTDDEAWHHLMKYIRHEHSYIPAVHLKIDKGFWQLACWRDGALAVVNQKTLRNSRNPHDFPNFLEKVARIAAPADRWMNFDTKKSAKQRGREYDKDEDSYCRSDGTLLQITIDGTDSTDKQIFVQRLEELIQRLRRRRPLFEHHDHYDDITYARTEAELIEHGKDDQRR